MPKLKDQYRSRIDVIVFAIVACLFFGSIVFYAHQNPTVRLDHFESLATVLGSFATALTLYWLVVERNAVQQEKADKEKLSQAEGVSVWLEWRTRQQALITVSNKSHSPIYNVVLCVVDGRDANSDGRKTPEEFRRYVHLLPPGVSTVEAPKGFSGAGFIGAIEIGFDDTNNRTWIRKGNGRLIEGTEETTLRHYAVHLPPTYSDVKRVR